jgi:hypothetical protein
MSTDTCGDRWGGNAYSPPVGERYIFAGFQPAPTSPQHCARKTCKARQRCAVERFGAEVLSRLMGTFNSLSPFADRMLKYGTSIEKPDIQSGSLMSLIMKSGSRSGTST